MLREVFVLMLICKTALYVTGGAYCLVNYEAPPIQEQGLNACQRKALPAKKADAKLQWAQIKEWCNTYVWQEKEGPGFGEAAYRWWNKDHISKCHEYSTCLVDSALSIFAGLMLFLVAYMDYACNIYVLFHFYGDSRPSPSPIVRRESATNTTDEEREEVEVESEVQQRLMAAQESLFALQQSLSHTHKTDEVTDGLAHRKQSMDPQSIREAIYAEMQQSCIA